MNDHGPSAAAEGERPKGERPDGERPGERHGEARRGDELQRLRRRVAELEAVERRVSPRALLQLLQSAALAVHAAPDADAAVRACLDQVCRSMHWPLGHAYSVDERGPRLRSTGLWCGREQARFLSFVEMSTSTRFEPGAGLPGRVLGSGSAAWVLDVTRDENFPRREAARVAGLRSGFAFPVRVQGRIVAVLEFFCCETVQADDPLLEVAEHIGVHLGLAFERHRHQDALRQSEERYRVIAETASDAFLTIDEDSRILFVNPAAEAIFGWAPHELIGRPLLDLMPGAAQSLRPEALQEYVRSAERTRAWAGMEVQGLHRDGRSLPLEVSFGEVTVGGRRTFTGIVRDVGERRRAREELEASARQLARRNEELEDFAYVASHDLKEPLRGITNYATFLLEDLGDRVDAESARRLQTMGVLAERMNALIEALLQYSRLGRQELALADVDCDAVVEEVLESLQVMVEEHAVEVRRPAPLPRVRGQRALLAEVWRNLITNAIKYNDGSSRLVEIGSERRQGELVLWVRDNGIGVPERHRDSVFKMFKRLHGRERYGGGTGAGLAIVKKIVERHGGRVWVEPGGEVGSRFCFTLKDGDGGRDDGGRGEQGEPDERGTDAAGGGGGVGAR